MLRAERARSLFNFPLLRFHNLALGAHDDPATATIFIGNLDPSWGVPFHFQDRGDVAVIGRKAGVTNIGWLGPFGRQSGFIAWSLWLVVTGVALLA